VNGEFFAKGERRGKSQTKDEAIYGVFLDGSDSDDDRRGKRQRTAADYSRPVAFRSTGQVMGGDQPPMEEGPQLPPDRQRAQSEEADEERPSFGGLGLGSKPAQGGGLGFTSAGTTAGGGAEAEDDEGSVLPGAFGARQVARRLQQHSKTMQSRDKGGHASVMCLSCNSLAIGLAFCRIAANAKQRRAEQQKKQAKEKQRQVTRSEDPTFAKFEQHTKGR
jgi:hypothetical protein